MNSYQKWLELEAAGKIKNAKKRSKTQETQENAILEIQITFKTTNHEN